MQDVSFLKAKRGFILELWTQVWVCQWWCVSSQRILNINYIGGKCKQIFQNYEWRSLYKEIFLCTLDEYKSKPRVINKVLYQWQPEADFELNPNLKVSSCPSPQLLLYLKFWKLTTALLNPRLFPLQASELVSLPQNIRCINADSGCRKTTKDGNKWHCFC